MLTRMNYLPLTSKDINTIFSELQKRYPLKERNGDAQPLEECSEEIIDDIIQMV